MKWRRAIWTVAAIAPLVTAALISGPKYFNQRVLGNFREVVPSV